MRNIVSAYVDRFLHDRRERLRFGGIVLLLALLVAFIVFWRLSAVGVAMTNEVCCGMEEHQHDSSCYEEVLVCGLEESAGSAGHTHDSSCYETVTELVCGLDESEGHIHDESCFDEDGNLICALAESEGHAHTAACYESTQILICGLEEEPAAAGHQHDKSCYEEVLVCDLTEHTHSMECMIDETADVETAEDWEATLPEDLSGVWAEDVVTIARSQLGYTESEANFQLAEDGESRQGYTRYGAWYGNEYGAWDGMFAAFCLDYAGVEDMPVNAGAYAWTVALSQADLYTEDEEYVPVPGDLVFLNTDEDNKADTVAIVEEVLSDRNGEISSLTVIQGDYEDAVSEYTLDLNDDTVVGFGLLPIQQTEEEAADAAAPIAADEEPDIVAEEVVEGENAETSGDTTSGEFAGDCVLISQETDYEAECDGVRVAVTVPAGALPEDAELSVSLYDQGSEEYIAAKEVLGLGAAEMENNTIVWTGEEDNLLVLDITFLINGVEVEPADTVEVTIDVAEVLPEDADIDTLEVQHLEGSADGMEAVVVADTGDFADGIVDENSAVAVFSVDSLSPFTVVWSATSSRTATITVNVYDMENNNEEITTAEGSYSFSTSSSGTFTTTYTTTLDVDALVNSITLGTEHDGYYTFAYAAAVYNGSTTYGDEDNSLTSIDIQKSSSSNSSTDYTFYYGSSSASQSHSRSRDSSDIVTINLYYKHIEPSVKISASAISGEEHVSGYILSQTTEHFDYSTAEPEITWSVEPDGYAELTPDNDGTAVLVWLDDDQDLSGRDVTVTVTATGVNRYGESVSVSDSITLYYDAAQVETIEIEDDIKYNGDLLAVVRDEDGNEILDHSGLIFVWYISDSSGSETDDSQSMIDSLLAATSYTQITSQDVFDETDRENPDDDRALNVARERGGLHAFYVEVYDAADSGAPLATSEVFYVPYAMKLLNGSFETPSVSGSMKQYDYSSVPYWSTTADDRLIEIVPYTNSSGWGTQYTERYRTYYIYAGGSQSVAGDQYAELNAESYGALYQDVLTAPGSDLTWSCSHRARTSGWDQNFDATNAMYVVMMSTNDAEMLLDGVSQVEQQSVVLAMLESAGDFGSEGVYGREYTLESGTYDGEATVTFSAWYESVTTLQQGEWNDNVTGTYTVPTDQYLTRFFFVAEKGYSPNNETDPTVGNLLDLAEFSQIIRWQIDYYVYNVETGQYELMTDWTQSGTNEVFETVYADYDETQYHLIGSVTGNVTGGVNPSFDRTTHNYLLLDQNSTHLSLYLMENGVVVHKTLDGFTDEQLEAIYENENGDAGFSLISEEELVDGYEEIYVSVGAEGTGLNILSPLGSGNYTITETSFAETLMDGSYIWQKVSAAVDGESVELTAGNNKSYYLEFELDDYTEIEFINYYVPLLTIEKVDSVDSDVKLSGAEFILSKTITEGSNEGVYYYSEDGWAEDESSAERLGTGNEGTVTAGLWDGTENAAYTLTEVKAPDGYTVLNDAITFTVTDGQINIIGGNGNASADGMQLTVKNTEAAYPVTVIKYAGGSEDKNEYLGLSGAEFVLGMTAVNGGTFYAVCEREGEEESWKVTGWVTDKNEATILISDSAGYIKLNGLQVGEYFLSETKAPDGYMLLESEVLFTVNEGGTVTVDGSYSSDMENVDIAIENYPGAELPHTGGMGIWMFVVPGLALAAAAGTALTVRISKTRKREGE